VIRNIGLNGSSKVWIRRVVRGTLDTLQQGRNTVKPKLDLNLMFCKA
jgi:hypothetical protein